MSKKGKFGEHFAELFLKLQDYEILDKNWTCQWGEIDLISFYRATLVFVEVKLRTSKRYGVGYESVSYHKKRAQSRAIEKYLASTELRYENWRFDVIVILVQEFGLELQHFQFVPLEYRRDCF